MTTEPMSVKSATEIVGGLSKPSKMPGYAYGLPAKECKVGSALVTIPNSVCSNCYALKGMYRFGTVQTAQYKRLASIQTPHWVEAMSFLINRLKTKYFRWHDSGDIQSPSHLEKIVEVAKACPDVKFWLPTREKVFIRSHLIQHGAFPANLVVRVSGTMIDGVAPIGFANTSTVTTSTPTCPAPGQNNECKSCRACWDAGVNNVAYLAH